MSADEKPIKRIPYEQLTSLAEGADVLSLDVVSRRGSNDEAAVAQRHRADDDSFELLELSGILMNAENIPHVGNNLDTCSVKSQSCVKDNFEYQKTETGNQVMDDKEYPPFSKVFDLGTIPKVSSCLIQQTPVKDMIRKLEQPSIPPKPSISPKPATTAKKEPTLMVRGLIVPVAVHALHLRVKDELKIVTATKRLKFDEADEIRMMEAELAERSKERRINKEKEELAKQTARPMLYDSNSVYKVSEFDVHTRTSPSVPGSQDRIYSAINKEHRRQSSDPLFAQFSPIEEDRDFENTLRLNSQTLPAKYRRLGSLSELRSSTPERHGPAVVMFKPADRQQLIEAINLPLDYLSTSSRDLDDRDLYVYEAMQAGRSSRLPGSSSVTSLPMMYNTDMVHNQPRWGTSTHRHASSEDRVVKEEKLHQLQKEIEKRRRHLNDIITGKLDDACSAYTFCDFQQDCGAGAHFQQDGSAGPHWQQTGGSGLIKPIDYQINPEKYYVRNTEHGAEEDQMLFNGEDLREEFDPEGRAIYSSYDYLTHKSEHTTPMHIPLMMTEELNWLSKIAASDAVYQDEQLLAQYPPNVNKMIRGSLSDESFKQYPLNYGSSRDSGVSSGNMTGTEAYVYRGSDREQPSPSYEENYEYNHPTSVGLPPFVDRYPAIVPPGLYPECVISPKHELYSNASGYCMSQEVVKPSDELPPPYGSYEEHDRYLLRQGFRRKYSPVNTPSMPILDDVKSRSRNRLRDIGCRPLSDDFDKYFQAEGMSHLSKEIIL